MREKTIALLLRSSMGWDHPRVCGKNSIIAKLVSHVPGSPPRVREKPWMKQVRICTLRITPACAGKTGYNSSSEKTSKDHPRVCGKNFRALKCPHHVEGSPPRMREKLSPHVRRSKVIGITPAYAGKTRVLA